MLAPSARVFENAIHPIFLYSSPKNFELADLVLIGQMRKRWGVSRFKGCPL